ncbi:MAG: hypothetical protein ABIS50_15085 [Luteolibacter sp.]|uniref:hypothetical protein n=1 Tax=Luteolibacter sp. TaxID=1962973 RepID=UPI003264E7E0
MSTPNPDPFDPVNYGGVLFAHDEPVVTFNDAAAKVRWKLKGGEGEGHVYQGQHVFLPCAGCSPPPVKPFVHREPEPYREHESRGPRAIIWPWLSTAAVWEELRYSIRSVERFFEDKECPIYIIGDAAPAWLVPGGRVQFIRIPEYSISREQGLRRAREIAVQIADEILYWNDDIYLLRPCGWDFFRRAALTEGNLSGRSRDLRASDNPWNQGLGAMVAEMELLGISPVMRFATHTPFYFEREKAREILARFVIPFSGGWASMYFNYHKASRRRAKGYKTCELPNKDPKVIFLNHKAAGPNPRTKEELVKMFPAACPWESSFVPAVAPLPSLSVSIMSHPSRRDMVAGLLDQLGDVPVSEDNGRGLIENCDRAWQMAGDADWHVVIQDDAILCDDFLTRAREFLATLEAPRLVSFYHGNKRSTRDKALAALDARQLAAPLRWGLAICLPAARIPEMLDFYRAQSRPDDDGRIGDWLVSRGELCTYALPCLVDHRHSPSLVGNSNGVRKAVAFLGSSTLFADPPRPTRRAPATPPPNPVKN